MGGMDAVGGSSRSVVEGWSRAAAARTDDILTMGKSTSNDLKGESRRDAVSGTGVALCEDEAVVVDMKSAVEWSVIDGTSGGGGVIVRTPGDALGGEMCGVGADVASNVDEEVVEEEVGAGSEKMGSDVGEVMLLVQGS